MEDSPPQTLQVDVSPRVILLLRPDLPITRRSVE